MSDNPKLWVLPREDYSEELRVWYGDEPKPWYWRIFGIEPRGHYDAEKDCVVVREDQKDNHRLVAHEYGHALGLEHPPILSPLYWLDVMGYGLRVLDTWSVLPRYRKWRGLE